MAIKDLIDNKLDSPAMRAKRLKSLRGLSGLSRDEICNHGDINYHTLVGWENARFGGLSASGAQKIIARVAKEGIFCTMEWLLNGKEPGPTVKQTPHLDTLITTQNNIVADIQSSSEEATIAEEAAFFMQKNASGIYLIVVDDGMLPHYSAGDYVAGKKKFNENISEVLGLDCIVQTEDNQLLLRRVLAGSEENKFSLTCLNLSTKTFKPIVQDISLKFAAPVLWHRKKELKDKL